MHWQITISNRGEQRVIALFDCKQEALAYLCDKVCFYDFAPSITVRLHPYTPKVR